MTDEIEIEGVQYISSKRASELSGYAQDYIGQLARGGYIDARRVGGLWHISLASVQEHEKKADIAKAQQPSHPRPAADAESLVSFDGKDYVSGSRAAHLTGYHQDYVGQLARSGTIVSRQVGNRWYVERDAILAHKAEKDRLLGAVQSASVGIGRALSPAAEKMTAAHDEATNYFTYTKECDGLLPQTRKRPAYEADEGEALMADRDRDNAISIRVKREPIVQMGSQNDGRKNTDMSSNVRPRRALAYGAVAAAAIVIVAGLTFGVSKTKIESFNAFVRQNFSYQGAKYILTSAVAAPATDSVWNTLERILVPELVYERTP